jgi:putative addiction module CopG family antidote
MNISLSPVTQKLLEEEMKRGGYSSADDVVRAALQTLNQVNADVDYEDLDEATRAAIERAEAQYERGEGIPVDEAFARLRRKHFGT